MKYRIFIFLFKQKTIFLHVKILLINRLLDLNFDFFCIISKTSHYIIKKRHSCGVFYFQINNKVIEKNNSFHCVANANEHNSASPIIV